MALADRVRNIILKPKDEWPVIAAEPATIGSIYSGYIAPLAAIPAIAGFIGTTFVGVPIPFVGTYRFPLIAGLERAVLQYLLILAGCYVLALVAAALAPSFGGVNDRVAGLKLAAYSYTPAWIAGIVLLLPLLAIVQVLASLYGLYLLYLGVSPVMQVPKERTIGYVVVLIVVSIVVFIVIGAIVAALGNVINPMPYGNPLGR